MKSRKAISMSLVMILLLTTMVTPVYAGGLKDFFGKKKLNPPSTYNYYWNGDYIELLWEQIEGGGYEITYEGKKYEAPAGHCWFDIKPTDAQIKSGIVEGNITVSTLPTDKKHKQSEPINMPFSLKTVNLSDGFSAEEVALLSKNQLIEAFESLKRYSVNTYEENDYSVVKISTKDDNNSGIGRALLETGQGYVEGAGKGISDNVENIGSYALENGNGVKDTLKKGKEAYEGYAVEGALEGAIDAAIKNYRRDKNIHYTYYYLKGEEMYSSNFMIMDYLASNNEKPTERLDKWTYKADDNAYYCRFSKFNRIIKAQYESKGEEKEKRWIVKYIPQFN